MSNSLLNGNNLGQDSVLDKTILCIKFYLWDIISVVITGIEKGKVKGQGVAFSFRNTNREGWRSGRQEGHFFSSISLSYNQYMQVHQARSYFVKLNCICLLFRSMRWEFIFLSFLEVFSYF